MIEDFVNKEYFSKLELKKKFLSAKPFPYIVLPGFFQTQKLEIVSKALQAEKFVEKNCDLFELQQTNDLLSNKNPVLKEFYSFFSSKEFLDLISEITGMKLKAIDMTGFAYMQGDYLLIHDDRLEGRKIAYIINLSKNFSEKDGGCLQLFDCIKGKPKKIVKTIIPSFNNFVLFQVSEKSFHQVGEVLSDKQRLSLGGWFHA